VIPIKNALEIESMRAAGRAAARVLEGAISLVRPGVTTGEIDSAVADLMEAEGCKSAFLGYRGFPGQLCISVNDEVVHGIGKCRKLNVGDLVKIDVGVEKAGWIGDNARTVCVGAPSPGAVRLMAVTEEALRLGVAQAKAGNRLGDVSNAIQKYVEANGFSVVREFVGHGVGRRLHEEPQVPNFGRAGTGPKLRPGMTLAIEPMVNAGLAGVKVLADDWTVVTSDGSLSAHFEHTVLVGRDAPEVLTRA
jgi:methionyl aminopeptidase